MGSNSGIYHQIQEKCRQRRHEETMEIAKTTLKNLAPYETKGWRKSVYFDKDCGKSSKTLTRCIQTEKSVANDLTMYRDTKVPEAKKCLVQDSDVKVLTTQAIENSQSVTKKPKSYCFETYQPTSLKSAEQVGDATGNIFSDHCSTHQSKDCNTSGATSQTLSDNNEGNVTSRLAIAQKLGAQHEAEPLQSTIGIKPKDPLPQPELDNSASSVQKENIELKFGVVQYTGQSKPVFGVPQNKNWRENSSRNWRKILNRSKTTIQPKDTEVDNNSCPWSNNHLRRVVVETKSVPSTSNQRDNLDPIRIINFVAVKVKGKEVAPGQRLPSKRTPIASCIKAKTSISSSSASGASLLGENTLKCEAFEHDVHSSYEDTTLEMKIDQCDSELEAATTDSAFSELTVTAPTSASNTPDLFQLDDEAADPIKNATPPPNEPLLFDRPAKDLPSLVSQNRSTYASKFSASKPNFITEKFLLASLFKTNFDAAKEEESAEGTAEEREKCGASDLRLAKARNTISTALSKQQLRDQYYRNNVTTTVPR